MPLNAYPATEPSRAEVDALPGLTLVEFGAPWCGICAAAQPAIAAALAGRPGIRHLKVSDGSGKPLTAGDVKQRFASVTRGTDLILVGTPEQVAQRIEEHAAISSTSGYMINPLISPGSLEDFVELVIPALQKRGLYRTQPQSGTLRSRLRNDRSSYLPASAHGASFRFA